MEQKNNPLHGITLQQIVEDLYEAYGWDILAFEVPINCFKSNPSVNSTLKFLRKTPWAREKVESFYLYSVRKGRVKKS
ncbi:MAG: VF530 family protein [Flavobacteriales bacterium]